MGDEGEARFLPLSFYDGKSETNVGQVKIHSSLDYKAFQSILSEKIGISSNQMLIYFVDNQKPMNERRILITGKASFNLILKGKDCTVLVVLKRSKKDNRQKSKLANFAQPSYYYNVNNNLAHQPNTFNLVGTSMPVFFACPVLPYYDHIAVQQFLNNNDRFRNSYNYPILEESKTVRERCNFSYCDECMNARSQGKAVEFHLCVNDAETASFRSPAGPIARPSGCFL